MNNFLKICALSGLITVLVLFTFTSIGKDIQVTMECWSRENRGAYTIENPVIFAILGQSIHSKTNILDLEHSRPATESERYPAPQFTVEPSFTSVSVGDRFTVEIWIRDIPPLYGMVNFNFLVMWDVDLMELVAWDNLADDRGWRVLSDETEEGYYRLDVDTRLEGGEPMTADAPWATLTFHCIGEGISTINVTSPPYETILVKLGTEIFPTYIEPCEAPVYQNHPNSDSTLSPVNILNVMTPYLLLIILIVSITTVVIMRKRHKAKSISVSTIF